mmetsp:Transcript_8724/g.35708  ORF Transcript_8724/g.35708 Transcript_8724/m.35708 type:complete len:456 (+) Transcript_8724:432-1799(+)
MRHPLGLHVKPEEVAVVVGHVRDALIVVHLQRRDDPLPDRHVHHRAPLANVVPSEHVLPGAREKLATVGAGDEVHRAHVRGSAVPEPVGRRRLRLVYQLLLLHVVHLDVVALPLASAYEPVAAAADPGAERVADDLPARFFAPFLDDPLLPGADAEGEVAEAGDDALVSTRVDGGIALLGDGDQAASLARAPGAEEVDRDRGAADVHGPAAHRGAGGHLDDLRGLVVPRHREPSAGSVVARGDATAVPGLPRAAASLDETPRPRRLPPSRVHREGFLRPERGPARRLGPAKDPELVRDDEPQPPARRPILEHLPVPAVDRMRRASERPSMPAPATVIRAPPPPTNRTSAAFRCAAVWTGPPPAVSHTAPRPAPLSRFPWTTAFTRSAATATCASTAPRAWVPSASDARRRRYPRRAAARAAPSPTPPPTAPRRASGTPLPRVTSDAPRPHRRANG